MTDTSGKNYERGGGKEQKYLDHYYHGLVVGGRGKVKCSTNMI